MPTLGQEIEAGGCVRADLRQRHASDGGDNAIVPAVDPERADRAREQLRQVGALLILGVLPREELDMFSERRYRLVGVRELTGAYELRLAFFAIMMMVVSRMGMLGPRWHGDQARDRDRIV